MIAPIALMIVAAHVLNKLSNESELIVMTAGMLPWVLFRPFLAVGVVVSLLVGVISAYVSPCQALWLRTFLSQRHDR
jgi:lipopolysaccharide export system permease protein